MPPWFYDLIKALGLFLIGSVFTLWLRGSTRKQSQLDEEAKEIAERLQKIDQTLAVLTTQVSPLWAAVQTKIAKDLTHPSPQFAEMDQLLRELEAMVLTPERRERLLELLQERITSTDPEVSEDEKESARLMAGVMAKVLEEAEADAPLQKIGMVGVKEEAEE